MSYILDAINKAEGTRKSENLNELSSEGYRRSEDSKTRKFIRGILIVLIPLLCFYLGYLARPIIENVTISYGAPSIEPVAASLEPEQQRSVVKPVVSDAPLETVLQEPQQQSKSAALVDNSPQLNVISYSETSTERFAMINGVIVYEGDILGSGEQVLQIDKTSVLLEDGDLSYVLTVN